MKILAAAALAFACAMPLPAQQQNHSERPKMTAEQTAAMQQQMETLQAKIERDSTAIALVTSKLSPLDEYHQLQQLTAERDQLQQQLQQISAQLDAEKKTGGK